MTKTQMIQALQEKILAYVFHRWQEEFSALSPTEIEIHSIAGGLLSEWLDQNCPDTTLEDSVRAYAVEQLSRYIAGTCVSSISATEKEVEHRTERFRQDSKYRPEISRSIYLIGSEALLLLVAGRSAEDILSALDLSDDVLLDCSAYLRYLDHIKTTALQRVQEDRS